MEECRVHANARRRAAALVRHEQRMQIVLVALSCLLVQMTVLWAVEALEWWRGDYTWAAAGVLVVLGCWSDCWEGVVFRRQRRLAAAAARCRACRAATSPRPGR